MDKSQLLRPASAGSAVLQLATITISKIVFGDVCKHAKEHH
jgi:hypothetical protein